MSTFVIIYRNGVAETSKFSDWHEVLNEAGREYSAGCEVAEMLIVNGRVVIERGFGELGHNYRRALDAALARARDTVNGQFPFPVRAAEET